MRKRLIPKINDLELRLEVASRSCQHYCVTFDVEYLVNRYLEIDAWFQRTTNRKWHLGYQMVT